MNGTLQGTVLNQRDGQPLGNVKLDVTGDGQQQSSTTGDNGEFSFSLPAGQYEMTARKEGFEEGNFGPLVVLENNPTNITVTLQPKDIG